MRLLQTDVPEFITDTLNNIRAGVQGANADGFIVEANGQEVSFTIEIVQSAQSVIQAARRPRVLRVKAPRPPRPAKAPRPQTRENPPTQKP